MIDASELLQPFQGLLSQILPGQSQTTLSSDPNVQPPPPTPNPVQAAVQAFQSGTQAGENPLVAAPGAVGAAAQTAAAGVANTLVPPTPQQQVASQQAALESALTDQRQADTVRAGSLFDDQGQQRANFRPESSGPSGMADSIGQTFSDLGTNLTRPDLNAGQKLAAIGGAAMQLGQQGVIAPVTQAMDSVLGASVGMPGQSDLTPEQQTLVNQVRDSQGEAAAFNAYWKIQQVNNPNSLYNAPVVKGAIEGAPLGALNEAAAGLRGVQGAGLGATAARTVGTALTGADILAQGPLAVAHLPNILDGLKEQSVAQDISPQNMIPDAVSRERQPEGWGTVDTSTPDQPIIQQAQNLAATEQNKNGYMMPTYTLPGDTKLRNNVALDPQAMRELMAQPYVAPFGDISKDLFGQVNDLVGWALPRPSEFGGLEASTERRGVNLQYPGSASNEIWASPWSMLQSVTDRNEQDLHAGMAGEMVDTFIHEMAHNADRGHGNAYEDALNGLYDQIGQQRVDALKAGLADQLRTTIPDFSTMQGDLERLMDAPSGYRTILDYVRDTRTAGDQLAEDRTQGGQPEGGAGLSQGASEARRKPPTGVQPGDQGPGEVPGQPATGAAPGGGLKPGVTPEGRLDPQTMYRSQQIRIAGRNWVVTPAEDTGEIIEGEPGGPQYVNVTADGKSVQQFPLRDARPAVADLPESVVPSSTTTPAMPGAQPPEQARANGAATPTPIRPGPTSRANRQPSLPRTSRPVRPQTGADGVPQPPVQALKTALHQAMYPAGTEAKTIMGLGTFVADADIMRDVEQVYGDGSFADQWRMPWDQITSPENIAKLGFNDAEELIQNWADQPPANLAAQQALGQSLLLRYGERLQAIRMALKNGSGDTTMLQQELETTNGKYLQLISALRRQSGELGRGLGIMRRSVEMAHARQLATTWENRRGSVGEWMNEVKKIRQSGELNDNFVGMMRLARNQIDDWLKSHNVGRDTPLMDQNLEMQVLARDAKGRYTKIKGQPDPTPEESAMARQHDNTNAILGRKIDAALYKQIQDLNASARHEAGLGLADNVNKLLAERDPLIEQMKAKAREQKLDPANWDKIENYLRPEINVVAPQSEFERAVTETGNSIDKLLKSGKLGKEFVTSNAQQVYENLGMLDKATADAAKSYREKLNRSFLEGQIKNLPFHEEVGPNGEKVVVQDIPQSFKAFLQNVDMSDSRQVQQAVGLLAKPNWWDNMKLIRVASLLSDTATIMLHPMSRAIWSGTAPLQDIGAAMVEAPLARLQGRAPEATLGMAGAEFRTLFDVHGATSAERELDHNLGALGGTIPRALRHALQTLQTGVSAYSVLDPYAAKGGMITWRAFTPLNNVFKAIAATNDFFQEINQSMLAEREVYREAVHLANTKDPTLGSLRDSLFAQADQAGISREAYLRTYIHNNPVDFPEMLGRAMRTAQERNLNEPLTGVLRQMQQSRAGNTLGFLIPFFKVTANVARSGIRFTPAGFLEGASAARAGDLALAADRYGQAVFGSMMMVAGGLAAANGVLTGYGPSDPNQRKELLSTGWQPFSVYAHGGYLPYEKIMGPFAWPLIFATSLVDAQKEGMSTGQAGAALLQFTRDTSGFLSSTSAIYSFKTLFDFISNPQANAPRFLENLAASMIPYVGIGHTFERIIDPIDRTPRGVVENMLQNAPGYGAMYEMGNAPGLHQNENPNTPFGLEWTQQPLDPRVGPTGQTVPRPGYGLPGALTPFKATPDMPDPVIQEAEAQGVTLVSPSANIGRGPLKEKLSPSQLSAYDQVAGQMTNQALGFLYQTDIYKQADAVGKSGLISSWKSIADKAARDQLGIQQPQDQTAQIPLKYRGVTDRTQQAKIDGAISAFNAAKNGGPAPSEEQLQLVTQYGDPTQQTPEYTAYNQTQTALRSQAEGQTAALLAGNNATTTGPERQSLMNAMQVRTAIKQMPRYIDASGKPVGNVQDWDRWDKAVSAYNALSAQVKKANPRLTQQINQIKAAQNPNIIEASQSSLDYERWFGTGQHLDQQKWQQLQTTPKFVMPGTQRPVQIGGRASTPADWAKWTAWMATYKKMPTGPAKTQATGTYRLLRRYLNPAWVNAIPSDNLIQAFGTDITNENAA